MSNSKRLCLLNFLIVESILIYLSLEREKKKPIVENNKFIIPKAEYFNQMIIGLILGDGTLGRKYEKGYTYFKYTQSLIHIDYIHHIFNIFVKVN